MSSSSSSPLSRPNVPLHHHNNEHPNNNNNVHFRPSRGGNHYNLSSPSVPRTGSLFHRSALERKLELLEGRFTQPLVAQSPSERSAPPSHHSLTSPYSKPLAAASAPMSVSNHSHHAFSFDSPSTVQQQQQQQQPPLQHYSSPSPAVDSQHSQTLVHGNQSARRRSSSHSSSQGTTFLRVRSKHPSATTLEQVQQAAARQMQKVAAAAAAAAAASTTTPSTPSPPQAPRHPPPVMPSSSTTTTTTTTTARRSPPRVALGTSTSSGATQKKRKSGVPVKREEPSVKENWVQRPNQGGSDPAPSTKTTTSARTPLRTRPSPRRGNSGEEGAPKNSSILDFFAASHKRRRVTDRPSSTTVSPAPTTNTNAATNTQAASAAGLDSLHSRIHHLEQQCRDQEEQLKAVANNRTILHTALQSALEQREQEIQRLQNQNDVAQRQSRRTVERLIQAESAQQAKEVRERLATDGARLGRIVYARAGLRGPAVETWEEGHALRTLQTKQAALQEQRKTLEARYRAAQSAAQRLLTARDTSGGVDVVGGIAIHTPLDAMEAVESVRYHLENVRRKEKDLMREEVALNDQKSAHIRALKRVASEDASRFRTRPKLHDRYLLRCLLGKGGFSEVWRAFDLVDLREVAVKIHQLDPRWSEAKKENYTKHVSREYEIHRNVRHPRIVSLYDVFEIDNNSFATVLEICNGTDLDALLKERRRLGEREARAVLLQILSGMRYLSQPAADGSRQGIIHYDLKPGNILFDEFGDVKITDFGLSKILDGQDPAESLELTSQGAGTYWYLSPECFIMDEAVRISNKVDVWSIGVIFYQMLFGRRPFGDGKSQDTLLSDRTMLNARKVSFPDKPQISNECKDFVRSCLTYDQAFRPNIAQICQHPYILKKL